MRKHTRKPEPRGDTVTSGGRGRVLIADDTDQLRRFLAKVLGLRGWSTLGVSCAQELGQALTDFQPQVVLLDWNLGEADGHELVSDLCNRGIPVIVLTGDPHSVTTRAVPVLAKPIDLDLLSQHITTAVRAP